MTLFGNSANTRYYLSEATTSIATTPVAMWFTVPTKGYLRDVTVASAGTTTGTITLTVTVNGGSDLTSGALTIAAGSGFVPSTFTFALTGVNAVAVFPGDVVTVTPSGGSGSNIPGAATLTLVK